MARALSQSVPFSIPSRCFYRILTLDVSPPEYGGKGLHQKQKKKKEAKKDQSNKRKKVNVVSFFPSRALAHSLSLASR